MSKLPLAIRFAVSFAIFGLVISLVTGLVSGVGFGTALLRAVIFGIVFGAVGYGYHFLLASQIPEVIELIETGSTGRFSDGGDDDDPHAGGDDVPLGKGGGMQHYSSDEAMSAEGSIKTGKRAQDGNFGDHIIVEGVRLDNEPKVMADAMRTMMARDEE